MSASMYAIKICLIQDEERIRELIIKQYLLTEPWSFSRNYVIQESVLSMYFSTVLGPGERLGKYGLDVSKS